MQDNMEEEEEEEGSHSYMEFLYSVTTCQPAI